MNLKYKTKILEIMSVPGLAYFSSKRDVFYIRYYIYKIDKNDYVNKESVKLRTRECKSMSEVLDYIYKQNKYENLNMNYV